MSRRGGMRALVGGLLVALLAAQATGALGQSPAITPAPLPDIGEVEVMPDGAQKTYDAVSIKQLMYLVSLSRDIAGGLVGVIDNSQRQLAALSGAKDIPLANSADDVAARKLGATPRQMAQDGLSGSLRGPPELVAAYAKFAELYRLDQAFDQRKEKALTRKLMADMAAHGAVAAALAETAFARADSSMDRLNDYAVALRNSPDVKTSVDINTRVNIEVVQQLNELLRSQAELTSIAGFYFMATSASDADLRDGLSFENLTKALESFAK